MKPETFDFFGYVKGQVDDLERLRPQIEAALVHARGTHTFDDIAHMVLTGRVRLWAKENSFCITEINEFPRKRIVHVFLAGGNMADMHEFFDPVAEAYKQQGCVGMSFAGRPGFVRALKQHPEWEVVHVTMGREI